MRKATKGWLIAATALTLAGCILFTGVMTTMGWNFSKLSTERYKTTEHTVTQPYHHITVDIDTADLTFVPSENNDTKIVCHANDKAAFAVTVENDTLHITHKDTRKWYERIAIISDEAAVTVYLPQGDYGKVSVHAATGDVAIPAAFTFDSITVDVSTGDITCDATANGDITLTATTGDITLDGVRAASLFTKVTSGDIQAADITCAGDIAANATTGDVILNEVRCTNLKSHGTTGDMKLTDVIASQAFELKRNTGDILFTDCDAAAITAKTTTGDITGNLLSDKVFTAKTTTGDVVVPASAGDGKCTLSATTGDITLTIKAH